MGNFLIVYGKVFNRFMGNLLIVLWENF